MMRLDPDDTSGANAELALATDDLMRLALQYDDIHPLITETLRWFCQTLDSDRDR